MSRYMRIICAGVACGLLATAMTAMATSDNEKYSFTNTHAVTAITNGWGGWIVNNQSGGTSEFYTATSQVYGAVTTGVVAKVMNSSVGHDFTTLDQKTNVWVSMRISPILNDTEPTPVEITNAAAVFWFGSDSNVYYYNNLALSSNSFGSVVSNGAWYDVTAHLDYKSGKYDLFVNSSNDANRVVSNITFYSANGAFTNVTVIEKATEAFSYVDYVGAATKTNTVLATAIQIKAYTTADGVGIEFTTTGEQAAGVQMAVKRADGSIVGYVTSLGSSNGGTHTYRLIDSLAIKGGTYNYTISDDIGNGWAGSVKVVDEFSASVTDMTLTSVTLTWKSRAGVSYDIYKATVLPNFTKILGPVASQGETTSQIVLIDSGDARAFFKIQEANP